MATRAQSLAPELAVSQWFNTPEPLSLAGLRGKVVLLHAFQMLCPGCTAHGTPQAERAHQMFGRSGLLPQDNEMADYFRWLFFAAGPVEAAVTTRALGLELSPDKEAMAGWGSFERALTTLESHFAASDYVCGRRFTMADVYVGSQIDWGLNFGTVPPNQAFVGYAQRLQARDAYQAAKAIDNALIQEMRS